LEELLGVHDSLRELITIRVPRWDGNCGDCDADHRITGEPSRTFAEGIRS